MTTSKAIRSVAGALSAAACLLLGTPLKAGLRGSDNDIATFMGRHVASEVRRLNIPGASLAVLRDGRVILIAGYGNADLGSQRPMEASTPVRQLSIAKTFIWLLAMQLAEKGRLDLDRDLNAYLDFKIPDGVTMRHLMTHSSGLADPFGVAVTRGATLREDVASNVPERVYPPGSTIAYSNYDPALAAYVVERLHGRPFESLLAQRILDPLGMSRSSIADPLLRPMLAQSYGASAREAATVPPMGPATRVVGGLSAPAIDMARYLAMLQSGGGRIVSRASLARMMSLDRPLGPGLQAGLGLGFLTGQYRGVQHSSHGGSFAGGATDLQLLPKHGLAWAIAFNGRGDNGAAVEARGVLLRAVIDRFAAASAASPRPHGPSSAREVAGYYLSTLRAHSGPGRIMDAFALLRVEAAADGALVIEGDAGGARWLPQGPDRFVEPGTGQSLAVTRGPEGQVVRMASPLLNQVAEFERAPLAARWAASLLAAALPILLLGAVLRLRRRSRANVRGDVAQGSPLPVGLRVVAGAAPWVIIGTIIAWFAALFSGLGSGVALSALHLLTLAAILSALALAADAGTGWRHGTRSLAQSILVSAVALAALTIAWLFVGFGLTGL